MNWGSPLMRNDKLHLSNTWPRKWFMDFCNGLSKGNQHELYILMLTISFSNNIVSVQIPYSFYRRNWSTRDSGMVLNEAMMFDAGCVCVCVCWPWVLGCWWVMNLEDAVFSKPSHRDCLLVVYRCFETYACSTVSSTLQRDRWESEWQVLFLHDLFFSENQNALPHFILFYIVLAVEKCYFSEISFNLFILIVSYLLSEHCFIP